MNFSLLLPAGLFALGALLLPLLIHLQRRRETPPPRLFAALAFIDPQARPKRRLRFRDLPLLLLRLLLLAVLALLLAQPMLSGTQPARWVLLWPGLAQTQAGAIDDNAELRWLAPGFPRVEVDAAPSFGSGTDGFSGLHSPSSLLRQLAFERPPQQALEVRVPATLAGLDGAALELGRALQWTLLDTSVVTPDSAVAAGGSGARGPEPSRLDQPGMAADASSTQSAEAASAAAPLRIAVRAGTADSPATARVLAALDRHAQAQGANAPLQWVAAEQAPASSPVDALLQLGDEALTPAWQAWLEQGGRVLQALPATDPATVLDHADHDHDHDHADHEHADHEHDEHEHVAETDAKAGRTALGSSAHGGALADDSARLLWRGLAASLSTERVGRGELRRLSCDLQPSCLPELLEPAFPQRLAGWLSPLPALPDQALAADVQPLTSGPAPQPLGLPLRDVLIVLLLLLFGAERWLAASRRPA